MKLIRDDPMMGVPGIAVFKKNNLFNYFLEDSSSLANFISFLKASRTNFLILPAFWPYLCLAYLRTSSAISAGNLNENTSSPMGLPPVCYFTFKLYKLNPSILSNFLQRNKVNFIYYFLLILTCKLSNFQLVGLHGHRGFLFFKSPPFYEGRKEKRERRRIKINTISTNNQNLCVCNGNDTQDTHQGSTENHPEPFFSENNNFQKKSLTIFKKNAMNYNSFYYYLNVFIIQFFSAKVWYHSFALWYHFQKFGTKLMSWGDY